MLHELLVALRGHPGSLFIKSDSGPRLKVNPALPFLHPCEVVLLDQLLDLAGDYRTLTAFIRQHRFSGGSMYLEAVCQGLDMVLDTYRATLTGLEREQLESRGGQVPLSLVQHRLLPHRAVLRGLLRLVDSLGGVRGCMVLDTVYRETSSGVEGVGRAMRKVLAEGHKVLYKQLLAWLLQGALYDPHSEFFIVQEEGEGEESLLAREGGEGLEVKRSKAGRYRLEHSMVPGHISHRLAEKIFFIGDSIQLFESDRRVEVQGAVLRDREEQFFTELARLRDKEEFVVTEFSRVVDRIRETVSNHLHHLVMQESDLVGELRVVWDMFLLGRGELFHDFISAADPRLTLPPLGGATQHDTTLAWLAAVALHDTEDKVRGKVSPLVGKAGDKQGWDQLSLQYAVPWPLHLVVTPGAVEKYNSVFSFLLLVRRTQMALHQSWAEAMFVSRGQNRRGVGEEGDQTRTHMAFLVDNLQYYLMADVLETQISNVVVKMTNSTSFEEIRTNHDQFLTSVETSVFLHNPEVSGCLRDLLTTCLQFCSASSKPDLCTTFSSQASLLVQLLTSLRHHLASSSLAQLLTRVDYNRFFSTSRKKKTDSSRENQKEMQ